MGNQSQTKYFYLHDPKAADLAAGVNAGEYSLANGQFIFLGANINACEAICQAPCVPETWTITFADIDFGDCNGCFKSVGFRVQLRRSSTFDNQTYLNFLTGRDFIYEGEDSGVIPAADIATWFNDYFAAHVNYTDQHDLFGITTSVAGAVLTLVIPCPYSAEGIFQLRDNGLPTTERPVIAKTIAGVEAVLDRNEYQRIRPLLINYVPGQDVNESYFTSCEEMCQIQFKGCIDACDDRLPPMDGLSLSSANFTVVLFVNAAASGYAAFLAALIAAAPDCDGIDDIEPVSSGEVILTSTIAKVGANIDFASIPSICDGVGSYTGPVVVTITSGTQSVAVTVPQATAISATLLAAALAAAYPGGTFAVVAVTTLRISGTIANGANGTLTVSIP